MDQSTPPMLPAAARSSARSRRRIVLVLAAAALAVWALLASLFTVDVTQHALVTRFGAVVRAVPEPGLYVKAPFDRVLRLDRRLTFSRPQPAEYLTVDKRNVVVESLATWRIADPERYVATLATRANADSRLGDLVLGAIGSVLGKQPAASLIAPDHNVERFRIIVAEIRTRAREQSAAYGVEIVDLALLRLGLPEQNRAHVFDRMTAERGRMAKEYRTAGELLSRKIVAEVDHERSRIEAEAYAQVQRLKAEGDAEASRIYAAAFSRNAAFYKFLRTLQAYDRFLDENTTLFLPANAEVMRVLRPQRPAASGPGEQNSTGLSAKARGRPASAAPRAQKPGAALAAGNAPASNQRPR